VPKVTLTDIFNAVQTAKPYPEISRELRYRDEDKRLDCLEIKCRVISPVNSKREEYAMIFNYGDIKDKARPGVDIDIRVVLVEGEMKVTEWHKSGE
jgi:hypothetical protein